MRTVRQRDRIEKEERLVLLRAHPALDVLLDEFLRVSLADALAGVAREFEPLVVAVEIGREVAVGVALAVVAEEVVEAVLQRAAGGVEHAHAPFAHAGGGVAVILKDLGHRDGAGRQRELALGLDLAIGAHRAVAAVLADHERGAARGADGGAAIALGEARAFLGHAVEVRRLDEFLPVAADVALGEVVAQDEDDVRLARFGRGGEGGESQKEERGQLHGGWWE